MSSNAKSASAGKKKGGGFLARQAKAKSDKKSDNSNKENITEEDILQKEYCSPDDVLKLTNITESKCLIL